MAYFYYFSNFQFQNQKYIHNALATAHSLLLKKVNAKKITENLKELEEFLNSLFYPQNSSNEFSRAYQKAQEFLLKDYDETIQNIFNNLDMDTFKSKVQVGIKIDERKNFRRQTLINAISNAQKYLQELSNMSSLDSSEKYLAIKQKIESLIETTNSKIDTLPNNLLIKSNNDIYYSLMTLSAFNKIFSSAKNISNKKAGDNFELALTRSINNISDNETNKLLKSIVGSEQTGSNLLKRGIDSIGNVFSVNYSITNKDKILNENTNGFTFEEKNMYIKYDPGSKKQGKMDVIFKTDEATGVPDFRISAKRWIHGSGDLGETSIDAGISREGGISVAEAYKLAVLTKVMGNAEKAHDFARLALVTDIAMGLNQGVQAEGGYANILIIDTGKSIHVKSLADIVLDIESKKRGLSGFNPTSIEEAANQTYDQVINFSSPGRSAAYFYKMTSTLNKMKVTINYSV